MSDELKTSGPGGPAAAQSVQLSEAIRRSLAEERRRASTMATALRLGSTIVIALIVYARWASSGKTELWARAMIPVTIYVLAALGFFLLRAVPAAARLAWLTGLVDVVAVGAILFGVSVAATVPPAVATFTLGLFTLVVASSGLTLGRGQVFLTAAAAAIFETWLLRSADIDWGVICIVWVVLFAVAATTQVSTGRLLTVISGLTRAEIARGLERMRAEVLSADKQRIEAQLIVQQAQNDALVALQQAKETLAQVIVHDLRSPLSSVMASLDMIRQELEDSGQREDLQRRAAEALKTSDRLTAMINDLLAVGKLEDGRLKPVLTDVSAEDVCREVRDLGSSMPRARRLLIEARIAEDIHVTADKALVTRMLENLMVNAVRFAEHRIRLSAERREGDVLFRVQNDGPAISPVMNQHLFEKFAQGERLDGGWGLGLYFCKLAAEVHGGSVAVEANPDWNVTFLLRLPSPSPTHQAELAA